MLVAVAMGVAFVTYLFVMDYMGAINCKVWIGHRNTTREHIADGRLKVYVQNIGKEAVSFDTASCIYVNGIIENSIMNKTTLLNGGTDPLTVRDFTGELNGLKVKVATIDGTSTEVMLQ